MGTIKLHCPAGAQALAMTSEGESTTCLIKHGLVITSKGIEFPAYLLDSVMWRVGFAHEILYDEERKWQSSDEINEMNALGRLLTALKKLGGKQNFEFDDADNYTGKAFDEIVAEVPEPETVKTVAVSLTASIAKSVCDFIKACDNGNDEPLGVALNDHQGGQIRLPQPCAQRLAVILALIVRDYQDCGLGTLSPKARFVYTRDAVTKALAKAGLIQDLNWWQ